MRISFFMRPSKMCIQLYDGHKKNASPLHERLKNMHWVLLHKIGVCIQLGSPPDLFGKATTA